MTQKKGFFLGLSLEVPSQFCPQNKKMSLSEDLELFFIAS